MDQLIDVSAEARIYCCRFHARIVGRRFCFHQGWKIKLVYKKLGFYIFEKLRKCFKVQISGIDFGHITYHLFPAVAGYIFATFYKCTPIGG